MKAKRFIAGAICPACKEQDKIFIYEKDSKKWRECAACNFKESISELDSSVEELPTRVNQPRLNEDVLAHEVPIETIRIFDPK